MSDKCHLDVCHIMIIWVYLPLRIIPVAFEECLAIPSADRIVSILFSHYSHFLHLYLYLFLFLFSFFSTSWYKFSNHKFPDNLHNSNICFSFTTSTSKTFRYINFVDQNCVYSINIPLHSFQFKFPRLSFVIWNEKCFITIEAPFKFTNLYY